MAEAGQTGSTIKPILMKLSSIHDAHTALGDRSEKEIQGYPHQEESDSFLGGEDIPVFYEETLWGVGPAAKGPLAHIEQQYGLEGEQSPPSPSSEHMVPFEQSSSGSRTSICMGAPLKQSLLNRASSDLQSPPDHISQMAQVEILGMCPQIPLFK